MRTFFLNWRMEAELRTVKHVNLLEGPTVVENHALHRQLGALKVLAADEGISSEKISKILQQA